MAAQLMATKAFPARRLLCEWHERLVLCRLPLSPRIRTVVSVGGRGRELAAPRGMRAIAPMYVSRLISVRGRGFPGAANRVG